MLLGNSACYCFGTETASPAKPAKPAKPVTGAKPAKPEISLIFSDKPGSYTKKLGNSADSGLAKKERTKK